MLRLCCCLLHKWRRKKKKKKKKNEEEKLYLTPIHSKDDEDREGNCLSRPMGVANIDIK